MFRVVVYAESQNGNNKASRGFKKRNIQTAQNSAMERINEFRIEGGFVRYRIKIWNDNRYEDENSIPQMDSQWFN